MPSIREIWIPTDRSSEAALFGHTLDREKWLLDRPQWQRLLITAHAVFTGTGRYMQGRNLGLPGVNSEIAGVIRSMRTVLEHLWHRCFDVQHAQETWDPRNNHSLHIGDLRRGIHEPDACNRAITGTMTTLTYHRLSDESSVWWSGCADFAERVCGLPGLETRLKLFMRFRSGRNPDDRGDFGPTAIADHDTPESIVDFCYEWGDPGIVATDLIAEKGWEAGVAEILSAGLLNHLWKTHEQIKQEYKHVGRPRRRTFRPT